MKKIVFLILISTLLPSCKKSIQQAKIDAIKPELNVVIDHPKPDVLDRSSKVYVEKWKEFLDLSSFLARFDEISANEALHNALELKNIVKSLKDSIKPEILDHNAFNVRINVLQNEVLRLVDMTYIPSIKAEEVNHQVVKILNVYGSVNQKINTIYSQKRFEEAVKVNGEFLRIDTSITNKKINIKKEKALHNRKMVDLDLLNKQKTYPKPTSKKSQFNKQ